MTFNYRTRSDVWAYLFLTIQKSWPLSSVPYPTHNTPWSSCSELHSGSSYTPKPHRKHINLSKRCHYFAFIIFFVIKLQFFIKIMTIFTNGQMFYLLHKTGMMNGWHRLPRKQGQPLPQTSSVKTRFHSLHPRSHCR